MIEIETQMLDGIEILHATPAALREVPLPTVLFYHGFTSSKLVYIYFDVALAQNGMRVVMPDIAEHGARFTGDAAGRLRRFWEILRQNFEEFPVLSRAIAERGWIKDKQFGVGGASMGGMTALGLMARHTNIRCAASLMGSGYYLTLGHTLFPPAGMSSAQQGAQIDAYLAPLKEYDITHRVADIADRPLLLWHGEDDDVVPAAESQRLQQALRTQGLDENLTWRQEAGVRHRITPDALAATCRFFSRFLKANVSDNRRDTD